MKHIINLFKDKSFTYTVDETTSLAEVRVNCPRFFAWPFGKRETYTMYRGCIIVRNTVTDPAGKNVRKTVVYLTGIGSDNGKFDTFCATEQCKNVAHAKRYIDACLHKLLVVSPEEA